MIYHWIQKSILIELEVSVYIILLSIFYDILITYCYQSNFSVILILEKWWIDLIFFFTINI